MYIDSERKIVREKDNYTSPTGHKYPKNFPKDEIPGLVKVTEVEKPTPSDGKIITGFHVNEENVMVWEEVDAPAPDPINQAEETLQKILREREDKYRLEGWNNPYDLIDAILDEGIEAIKTKRDAIKSAHPKP
jgi:hypothetical protein